MPKSEFEKVVPELESREELWQKEMLDLYLQGASDYEVMRELDLTPAKWATMEQAAFDSNFRETVEVGRAMARAWWETIGRTNIKNTKFNTALYKFNMANRFGWTEKSETSMTNVDFSNMDNQTLNDTIQGLYKRLQDAKSP